MRHPNWIALLTVGFFALDTSAAGLGKVFFQSAKSASGDMSPAQAEEILRTLQTAKNPAGTASQRRLLTDQLGSAKAVEVRFDDGLVGYHIDRTKTGLLSPDTVSVAIEVMAAGRREAATLKLQLPARVGVAGVEEVQDIKSAEPAVTLLLNNGSNQFRKTVTVKYGEPRALTVTEAEWDQTLRNDAPATVRSRALK